MKLILPENVSRIIDTLMRAGYEAYAVGGCIRDSLLGREPKDWDITTSASPAEVKALFPKTVDTGIAHGTVTVLLNREGFEVTTYRVDGTYEDFRHPKEVTFTPDLNEDLKRRDFTINAMAYNDTHGLIDAFDGAADLDRKIVRCVGAPKERFSEDALRMMRAVRFGAQLGFTVEEQTRSAICALAPTLKKISAERIQSELVSLLMSDHPEEMRTLYETGITKVILPEFDVMMQTAQNSPHHMYTVGEHTIQSLAQIESKKTLRLAMLFHDIGKPSCKTTGEDGQDHFYGHPQKGSEMARSIMRRLKFDNDTTQKVCCIVAGHDQNPPITERSVRRAAVSLGSGAFPDIFAVKRADILAQSDYQRSEKLAYVDQYEACYRSVIEKNQCLSLKDLAVSGRDLIAAGMRPGPALGNVLNRLFELVLDDPDKNETGYLLRMAREFAAGESA